MSTIPTTILESLQKTKTEKILEKFSAIVFHQAMKQDIRASSESPQLWDCKFISGTGSASLSNLKRTRSRTL
jgi:hypothetical protein